MLGRTAGSGASPSCGTAGQEGRGGSVALLELERPFKTRLSLEVLFIIIHLIRRVLPGGLEEERGCGAAGRGAVPVAVSRHILPSCPTAGRRRGRGGRAGPGLWPAVGGRSAGSGGLAGRRPHVNKSRTSPDICWAPCCPFPHSFFVPQRAFRDRRRCPHLLPVPQPLLAAAALGRHAWAAALTLARSGAGPEAPATLAVSSGSGRGCGRGSSGHPVPVVVLVSALLAGPTPLQRSTISRCAFKLNGLGWVEAEGEGTPAAVLFDESGCAGEKDGFSCPPLLSAPPCVTGKRIRRK